MRPEWEAAGLRVRVEDHVATLVFDRQDRMNAFDGPLSKAIREAAEYIETTKDVRVGVFTGAGPRAFSAGADLKAGAEPDPIGGFAGFVRFPRTKPYLAAVNGVAVGGGLELALACDFIVASERARFGFPEVTIGVAAGAGGMFRFPRAVPLGLARQYLLTGELFDAQEALRIGLVNRLFPADELMAGAGAIAAKIAANSPKSVELTRWVVDGTLGEDDESSWAVSDRASDQLLGSPDAIEGTRAFIEKRPPRWTS